MSIFNELLPKLFEISKNTAKSFDDELQAALERLDKFEEEYQNGRASAKDRTQKDKTLMTTLQSIHEDDDETNKTPETVKLDSQTKTNHEEKATGNKSRRVSKKRSKEEVEDMLSPEQDKRVKRNASVKAQNIISKQVNVNLNQKLRRENSTDKSRHRKEDDKENAEPLPVIQIKQEKISLPPEPMELESASLCLTEVKQERVTDVGAMPPPPAPGPKSRRGAPKDKEKEQSKEENSEEESSTRSRRTTKTRKQTDTMPPPAPTVPSARSTRASSRSTRNLDAEDMPPPPLDSRPKRTRAKKKVSEAPSENDKTEASSVTTPASPADRPRPKRTRRGKNAEKELPKPEEQPKPIEPEVISPKEERISQPTQADSPVLQKPKKNNKKQLKDDENTTVSKKQVEKQQILDEKQQILEETRQISQDVTRVLDKTETLTRNLNVTVTIHNEMDKTMVLPNGVCNNAPVICNETVVLESNVRETMVLGPAVSDATVCLGKDGAPSNLTDDNSLLTDDSEPARTPPRNIPATQPTSAVKEKVQQFEELAARTTRTKTRAMAKKDDEDNHTPPDRMIKPVLSQETLNKMNSMIFNGKPPQVSSSASKLKSHLPAVTKHAASTSKLSSLAKHKEAAEESLKKEKEDARKKKEALLEAKRELQKKKREEKMAAAAAAREAAERERRLAMEAAQRDRHEKQIHADIGKQERLREVERKKLELARKVAETEERRRAEEQARQQRLADEQRKAETARRKQLEEAEAMKKEAALMAKEIEKRQKEYLDKQKLKHRLESEKSYTPKYCPPMEPVYMSDGFQYLNSDEDEDPPARPIPAWSTSKARKLALVVQSQISATLVDKLFSVRIHSPDLRAIFPNIERNRLKRTSSAVWRTPPRPVPLPPLAE